MATNANNDDDEADLQIGGDSIDGDGVYPFAGLTRFDREVDAMNLPETVWSQQSSMKYWANQKVQHQFSGRDLAETDLDPDVLPERGLNTMIDELPRASPAKVEVLHPRTGERLRTLKSKAVVNPAMMEKVEWGYGNSAEVAADKFDVDEDAVADSIQAHLAGNADQPVRDGLKAHLNDQQVNEVLEVVTGDDALYNIPTSSYSIINPSQFLRPLTEVLQERELGDKVFGEVRLSRGGGRATLDLFMDGQHVESPTFADDREPIVVGLEINWDFFGDWAVRASGQGLDWNCDNRIVAMTDREIVKHAGDVESRQDWKAWFADLLDRLDEKRDHLSRIIQDAAEETLDFSSLPDDIQSEFEDSPAAPWTALYGYMGLPGYLAEEAGKRLRADAEDAYEPDWWEIHSAATYAVTHHDRGDRLSGGSFEDHARVANDMLFNPASMEDRIVEAYEADHEAPDEEDLAGEAGGIAEIRNAFESVRDKKSQYEEWEEELRDMGVEV